ncbi:MAG: 16S rRNA (uracil(1498)-N(3))-methyltransferase [Burkholderiales bacterium]|nr:16S rRNA (uracil(1498)-N(3))-methyltransferase [Burkholderiales bacterium]
MRIPRVYHRDVLQVGRDIALEEASAHHLARVLRVRPGDPLIVFDGTGGEYHASVRSIERTSVRARVERFDPIERESALGIGLIQAVSAGERMELTVQKAVELGVAWIQPLLTRRSKVRLEGERAERRLRHWQNIAAAACEQCGRNRLPAVRALLDLPQWLAAPSMADRRLLLEPSAQVRLSSLAPPPRSVELLAGAESGFAPDEIELATHHGFVPVRLGARVLRTETAGLAALAALQALWGDF